MKLEIRTRYWGDDDQDEYFIGPDGEEGVPEYSTDIAAAWQVVEHMQLTGWQITMSLWTEGRLAVTFWQDDTRPYSIDHRQANSAPHAICLAALRAVGHPV